MFYSIKYNCTCLSMKRRIKRNFVDIFRIIDRLELLSVNGI